LFAFLVDQHDPDAFFGELIRRHEAGKAGSYYDHVGS
jgi:hypothetical protein